uniref:Multidrug and toxin extrusion protein n=1 Tax=Ursus maritimus TaxID=29073 RepID=A0A452TJH0_URSMA
VIGTEIGTREDVASRRCPGMQGGQQPGLGMDSVQDTIPQDRGGCCPALRRLVPVGFGAEVWTLFVLSGPLFLFQVLTFMIHVVSSVFCGHLGKLELASFVNVCGVSIGLGLSSACDTLMSQSFGSPNKKHVGVILQRGTLVLLLCCFPCWALFLNTQQILLLFRQDPAVPRTCPGWATPLAPALHALHLFQGIVWPQVFSGIVGNCINGLANYILVSMLRLGVSGWALGLLFLGWSSQCLQDWGPFFSLAVPSMLMVCIEWWAYEIGSFVMGTWTGTAPGTAILYELATVVYMIPLGLSNAVCVRVGTALGAADTAQAKRSAISGMLCTGIRLHQNLLVGCVHAQTAGPPPTEEVIALVNKVLPIYIVFQLFEAVCCVYGGVLRGTGKQAFGAIVNAVMYYVVGLPLGIVLTFVVRMRIMGLWLGMLASGLLAAAAFAVYTARMDWKLAAEEAQKHAGLLPQSPDGTVTTVTAVTAAPRPGPAKAVTSSVATGNSPGIALMTYSRPECHLDLFRTPEAARALSAPASPLSVKQLPPRMTCTWRV